MNRFEYLDGYKVERIYKTPEKGDIWRRKVRAIDGNCVIIRGVSQTIIQMEDLYRSENTDGEITYNHYARGRGYMRENEFIEKFEFCEYRPEELTS